MIKLGLQLDWNPNRRWRLAQQMGVRHGITTGWFTRPASGPTPWSFERLLWGKQRFVDAGFELPVIGTPPIDAIRLGLEEKEQQYDDLLELIDNMGRLEIPVLCYNFIPRLHAVRTSTSTVSRGGALVTSYDHSLLANAPETDVGEVSDQRLWENFHEFLERVVPAAESANVKLALHPDDPPVSPLRGMARIFRTVESLEKAVTLVESPSNGLTFCQGTVSSMGVNVIDAIWRLGGTGKIFFVHFRDVRGTPKKFVETFHDDGQTDMYDSLAAYRDIGFEGPMRPDHAPVMDGEPNGAPMYEDLGRLFAIGYIRGLMDGVYRSRT